MNKIHAYLQIYPLLFSFVFITSCSGQDNAADSKTTPVETTSKGDQITLEFNSDPALQLSRFVRRILQDKGGNLWFGTNGDGVIRYNGDTLEYFSINEGFGGVAVRGIVEDINGNIWFGTEGGITKYDPSALLKTSSEFFTNYTTTEGLINNDVWSILIDSEGILWIGTLDGVCKFDGKVFTPFDLPESVPDNTRGVTSAKIVHCIMEDSKGQMWFSTNSGAYIYNSATEGLTNISVKDGLCDNNVNDILEDKKGNIWFATHHNGVSFYDGKSFTNFTKDGVIGGTEVWSLYEDKAGNIWFPAENFGVYKYDGKSFTNFQKDKGLTTNAIQCIFEDREGRLWLGGWMGLFRYNGKSIFSVTKNGPWK
jgi:ligand-binding sensor domain-containing protein